MKASSYLRHFISFICYTLQILPAVQQSLERHVSDAWSDDILTDSWNGVPRGCGSKPADVYLVLDTSDDTTPDVVQQYKDFAKDLTALFYLHKSSTRLGIVSYGYRALITSSLGMHATLPAIQQAVVDTPRVGGSRRTARTLKYLRLQAFSDQLARREVAHVVILLTSGQSRDALQLTEEANLLRKQGVYVYLVSDPRASEVERSEFKEMSSRPWEQFVFSTDNWNIVSSLLELLHIKECNYQVLPPLPGKEPVCVSRRPTELLFTLEHLALGGSHTQQILQFIQQMLAEVDPRSDIKAAILTSKDPIARYAVPGQVETIEALEEKLGRVVFPDLGNLLKRAGRTLMKGRAARTDNSSRAPYKTLQKVVVLFLDDKVQVTRQALAAVRSSAGHKLDIYVVYVGEELTNDSDLRELASGDDHVIWLPGYQSLHAQATVADTLRTICTASFGEYQQTVHSPLGNNKVHNDHNRSNIINNNNTPYCHEQVISKL